MEIVFRIRDVDLPDRVLAATRDKMTRLAQRWRIDRADVCFSEERNPRITKRERCAITLWGPSLWGKGRILRAEALAGDAGVAANRVMGVLERRANKLVGRLTVHFLPNWSQMGLLSTPDDRRGSVGACGGVAGIGDSDSGAEAMMPEDAALEMLAWDQDRWRFVDAETGRAAVLERRRDGAIAMAELVVDPAADHPAAERPFADHPAADHPAADHPAAERPFAERPATELVVHPAAERPAAQRPAGTMRVAS